MWWAGAGRHAATPQPRPTRLHGVDQGGQVGIGGHLQHRLGGALGGGAHDGGQQQQGLDALHCGEWSLCRNLRGRRRRGRCISNAFLLRPLQRVASACRAAASTGVKAEARGAAEIQVGTRARPASRPLPAALLSQDPRCWGLPCTEAERAMQARRGSRHTAAFAANSVAQRPSELQTRPRCRPTLRKPWALREWGESGCKDHFGCPAGDMHVPARLACQVASFRGPMSPPGCTRRMRNPMAVPSWCRATLQPPTRCPPAAPPFTAQPHSTDSWTQYDRKRGQRLAG